MGGIALIDGIQVETLDPYWLFAAYGDAARDGGAQPVCALPEGDPWMDNMLRPLIESLGYRVVAAREGVAADILIQSAEAEGDTASAAQVLRIRSRPDADGAGDSIYRYDRAASAQRAQPRRGEGKGQWLSSSSSPGSPAAASPSPLRRSKRWSSWKA